MAAARRLSRPGSDSRWFADARDHLLGKGTHLRICALRERRVRLHDLELVRLRRRLDELARLPGPGFLRARAAARASECGDREAGLQERSSWLALPAAGAVDVAGGVAAVVLGESDVDAGKLGRLAGRPSGAVAPNVTTLPWLAPPET